MKNNQEFEEWVLTFIAEKTHLFSEGFIKQAFSKIEFLPEILQKDNNQTEHNLAIWTYINRVATHERVKKGQYFLASLNYDLNSIAKSYGVSPSILLAIWGVETSFGQIRGNRKVLSTLATLAFDGRRREFFVSELIAALTILHLKFVKQEDFLGSWAGAMGHTQFMPSSYLSHAVDYDQDGVADIWSENPIDALASTASYLKNNGWLSGVSWGENVSISQSFDFALAAPGITKTVSKWAKLGIICKTLDKQISGSIVLPAGVLGPKFLTTPNFEVIKTYNRSNAYALGVAFLSDQIDGQSVPDLKWPEHEKPLMRSEISELQRLLTVKGCNTQGTDGIIGPNTEKAIRKFQKQNNLIQDGFHSISFFKNLRS